MNNYSILGLKSGATLREVKLKFRSLSKELHPDVNGGDKSKTDRFVIVLAAYEALLKGDAGETVAPTPKPKKTGTYRFEGIKKDKEGYLISFYVENIEEIRVVGKDCGRIGRYDMSGDLGIMHLRVSFEDAKKAKYIFECNLYDEEFNYASHTYKVKNPSWLCRLKESISKMF